VGWGTVHVAWGPYADADAGLAFACLGRQRSGGRRGGDAAGLALLRTSGDWMGGVTDGAPRYLLRPRARSPFFVPRIEVALVNWEAPV
jgi:hypothetical protein